MASPILPIQGKDRVAELTAIRDQSRLNADRGGGIREGGAQPSRPRRRAHSPDRRAKRCGVRPAAIGATIYARWPGGVEADEREVRVMGSKGVLLRTLVAASGGKSAGMGVPSFVPKWRAQGDSNPCFRRERA
jgi:hypothetical protein